MNTAPSSFSSTPNPTPIEPQLGDDQVDRKSNKKLWIIGGAALVLVMVVVASLYSTFLGAKVAPGRKFKILGPSTIQAGQTATITWDISTEITKQYPYEKIEYCYGKLLKRKCVVLAAAAPNNGKAVVKVPTSIPAGKGYFQFTARDPKKKLFGSMVAASGAVTVKPAETASSSNGGGGSGGGGGGGSGGGGGGGNSGGGGNNSNPNELALSNINSSDTTINSFRVSFNTSLATDRGDLYFRKKGTENWDTRSNEFLPTTSFSFVADNLESNTDYEYKVRGFRYKSQDCRIANCAYESKESDIRSIHTNQPGSPFELTYVRACFDREPFSGSSSTYPVVRLAWESDQSIPDTSVHFMTREVGTSQWFDWWTIFSPNDPNYGTSQWHHNGNNKKIRTDIAQGPSSGGFKPNTAYEFQYQDSSGRTLTNVIPFNTANVPATPSTGLSTCRDNIIHEQGSTVSSATQVIVYARNPNDSTNYRGYFSVDPATRQVWLNPDPRQISGTVALKYCGPIPENAFAPMRTILDDLRTKLPISKTNLGLARGVGKENIVAYLSRVSSYELGGYGNANTDFPTPLRELQALLHQYAHDYCGTDLTFP